MKNRTVRAALSAVLAFVFIFSSAKATYALWKVRSDTVNKITIGSVQGEIVENFRQGQTIYPGAVVEQKAQFKNTGNADMLVRVKVEKAWGTLGADGKFAADASLNTDNILLQCEKSLDSAHWLQIADYYYYKGVVKPGGLTPPLFENYTLAAQTGNAFKNKQAEIRLRLECLQAGGDSITFWNTTLAALGIVYKSPLRDDTLTKAAFISPAKGFTFEINDGDLFANFKYLVPGESYSQLIEVQNRWSAPVELFLHAESGTANSDIPTQMRLDKLLREYAVITLTKPDGTVIYQGSVWGNLNSEELNPKSMRYDYNLGEYAPGELVKLHVSLSLDKEVDEQYSNLLGLVNWVFSAGGTGAEPTTTTTTKAPPPSSDKPTWPTLPTLPTKPTQPGTKPSLPSAATTITTTATAKPTWPATPPKGTVPNTGGEQNPAFWAGLAIVSGLLLLALWIVSIKERRRAQ